MPAQPLSISSPNYTQLCTLLSKSGGKRGEIGDGLDKVKFQRDAIFRKILRYSQLLSKQILPRLPDLVFIDHEKIKHITTHKTMLKE